MLARESNSRAKRGREAMREKRRNGAYTASVDWFMVSGTLVRDRASWRTGRVVGVETAAPSRRWVRFLTVEETALEEVGSAMVCRGGVAWCGGCLCNFPRQHHP